MPIDGRIPAQPGFGHPALTCSASLRAPRALFISKASVVWLVVLVVGSDGAGQPVVIVVDASIIATIVPHAGFRVLNAANRGFNHRKIDSSQYVCIHYLALLLPVFK